MHDPQYDLGLTAIMTRAWKSDEVLIRNLVDIASKGGNYLLNIGPKGDGSLTPETYKAFKAIGEWMEVNSESIYGTQASPFEKLDWGRCTRKKLSGSKTRLYLHVFSWPKDGKLIVPGLASKSLKARLLAGGKIKDISSDGKNVTLTLPDSAPDKIVSVVALDIKGTPEIVK